MKKYAVCFLAIICLFTSTTVVNAATTGDFDKYGIANIGFNGTAEPVDISAMFSITANFIIDPNNESDPFISPTLTFINKGNVPLTVTALSMIAADSTSPLVCEPDRFSDWTNLGIADTKDHISFGIRVPGQNGDSISWFNYEGAQGEFEIGSIDAGAGKTLAATFVSNHGMAWEQKTELHYTLMAMVSLRP